MLRRIAGSDDVSSLKVLADVLEPVKDYTREETATEPATSAKPLNRVVDAVRPESATARQFAESGGCTGRRGPQGQVPKPASEPCSSRWRDNQVELQPMFEKSILLKEVAPISQNLSASEPRAWPRSTIWIGVNLRRLPGSPNSWRWLSRRKNRRLNFCSWLLRGRRN